jgi:hypothetical protein
MQDDGDDEGLDISAPEANGYEFQSNSVIEMLEKLLDKFIEEKTALEKKEANAKHAYDMLVQDLKARIELDTKDKTESSSTKGQTLHSRANDWSSELEELKLRSGDQSSLQDLQAVCAQKASEFESRQQLRTDEIAALQQAIDIMSSDSVSGHAQKYLPSMMQTKKVIFGNAPSCRWQPSSAACSTISSGTGRPPQQSCSLCLGSACC